MHLSRQFWRYGSRPARGGWIEIRRPHGRGKTVTGPAPHGAGGLKYHRGERTQAGRSPAPHGAGGLKSNAGVLATGRKASRPARGGWIEIMRRRYWAHCARSRPARGGWIEIQGASWLQRLHPSPAPHGAGGLKWTNSMRACSLSRPAPHGAGGLKFNGRRAKTQRQSPAPHGAGGLKSMKAKPVALSL